MEKVLERPASFVTSYMAGREDKRTNNRTMLPNRQNNAAAGYKGPVKNRAFERCRSTEGFSPE